MLLARQKIGDGISLTDGLDTWQPRDEELYRQRGRKTAREGYVEMSREYLPA